MLIPLSARFRVIEASTKLTTELLTRTGKLAVLGRCWASVRFQGTCKVWRLLIKACAVLPSAQLCLFPMALYVFGTLDKMLDDERITHTLLRDYRGASI